MYKINYADVAATKKFNAITKALAREFMEGREYLTVGIWLQALVDDDLVVMLDTAQLAGTGVQDAVDEIVVQSMMLALGEGLELDETADGGETMYMYSQRYITLLTLEYMDRQGILKFVREKATLSDFMDNEIIAIPNNPGEPDAA